MFQRNDQKKYTICVMGIAIIGRFSACVINEPSLELGLFIVSGESSQDITMTEQSFGCILDRPKVRNTYF